MSGLMPFFGYTHKKGDTKGEGKANGKGNDKGKGKKSRSKCATVDHPPDSVLAAVTTNMVEDDTDHPMVKDELSDGDS